MSHDQSGKVLAEYMRRIDNGEAVDVDAICQSHPEIEDELRSYIENEAMLAEIVSTKETSQVSANQETLKPGHSKETDGQLVGKMFGRYKLKRQLGQGAMGAVFLARDTNLERDVALKTPTISMTDRAEFLARFKREAQSAAQLKHPNICPVHDFGEVEGVPFITMGLINGYPLSRLVIKENKDQRWIASMVRTIADALKHAHEQGVVHRDLKPGNILVEDDGTPYITDFGLACRVNDEEQSRLTQEGAILGTPSYMSPEQVDGRTLDIGPHTDVYALGVILYELLCGETPFRGALGSILAQITRDEPKPPEGINPYCDKELSRLALKMLSKQPADRPSSMGEVVAALDDFLASPVRDTAVVDQQAQRNIEKLEATRQKIEALVQRGQYAQALQLLEKMAAVTTAEAVGFANWARAELPRVQAIPKKKRDSLPAIVATAKKMVKKHDYGQAAELLQQIPSNMRTDEVNDLLHQAIELQDEVDLLLTALRECVRRKQFNGIDDNLKRLLEIKPGNRFAKELWESLQTYSKVPYKTRKYNVDSKGRLLPNEDGLGKAVIGAIAFGVVVFGLMLWGITIYLKSGNETLAVTVDEEMLKNGEITLTFDGKDYVIDGPEFRLNIAPGEYGYEVRQGSTIIRNPETFTVVSDGRNVLEIGSAATTNSSGVDPQVQRDRQANSTRKFPVDGRFTNARAIVELNQGGRVNAYPWLSPDGLTIYWTRESAEPSAIYQATRKDFTSRFENIRKIAEARLASFSPDGLEIVALSDIDGDGKMTELSTERRTSLSANFPALKPMKNMSGIPVPKGTAFSDNGNELLVSTNPQGQESVIYRFARSNNSTDWQQTGEIDVTGRPLEMHRLTWPSYSNSGEVLIFSYSEENNPSGEWGGFARATVTPGYFYQPKSITVDGNKIVTRGGRYCNASGELFYCDSSNGTDFSQLELRVAVPIDEAVTSNTPLEVNLFNGRDFSGWREYESGSATISGWQVRNGELTKSGPQVADIRTEKMYENFILDFEWKVGKDANSGVFYRVPYGLAQSNQGAIEYQIIDNNYSKSTLGPEAQAGAIFGLIPAVGVVAMPTGQWNRSSIVAKGHRIQHWLNDKLVAGADTSSSTWKELITSKVRFKDYPNAGQSKPGYIVLQGYEGDIWYRNIKIKILDETTAAIPASQPPAPASRLYVNAAAALGGDGRTWAGAYQDLQQALEEARIQSVGVKEIWVAKGTYHPGENKLSFELVDGVDLIGGFTGNETSRNAANHVNNQTTLSGDNNEDSDGKMGRSLNKWEDNSFQVVGADSLQKPTLLRGFVITHGVAGSGQSGNHRSRRGGGGIHVRKSNLTIEKCLFTKNWCDSVGAAMHCEGPVIVSDCTFLDNFAFTRAAVHLFGDRVGEAIFKRCTFQNNVGQPAGGAFWSYRGPKVIFANCQFYGNRQTYWAKDKKEFEYGGGACVIGWTDFAAVNCLFHDNFSSGHSGALQLEGKNQFLIQNCTFGKNEARQGGAPITVRAGATLTMKNTIVWDSEARQSIAVLDDSKISISNSCIFKGDKENGNSTVSPLFISVERGDFHLEARSRAINNGDKPPADLADLDGDGDFTESVSMDLDGKLRVQGGQIDIGAYEIK